MSGIVVTSLDGSESESDEPDTNPDITISPALLDRLKKQDASNILKRPPTECQALVLYRPIDFGSAKQKDKVERKGDAVDRENVTLSPMDDVDGDAMDVEP